MLRSSLRLILVVAAGCFAAHTNLALAQPGSDAAAPSPDEEAIQQAAVKFVEAYGKKDAAAIAALFGPEARLEEADGTVFEGREAIRQWRLQPVEVDGQAIDCRLVTPITFRVDTGAPPKMPEPDLRPHQSRYPDRCPPPPVLETTVAGVLL